MFSTIVSPQNPRVKSAAQLKESRVRRREGLFLVDGVREVVRAWSAGFRFIEVFWNVGKDAVADERIDVDAFFSDSNGSARRNEELKRFLKNVDANRIPTIPVSDAVFEKIGFGERNEGVVAVVESRRTSLDELEAMLAKKTEKTGEQPLVAVVEGVEKPGNIGAILRSADGAGVDALIIAASEYDVFNPNAIRGSLGAIFHLPTVVASAPDVLEWCRRRTIQRATALCDDSIPYEALDYRRPTAIILGSEAEGLSEIWAREAGNDAADGLLKKIRLPMLGIADSLNVSNAAAVLFYEARRVRSLDTVER